MRIGLIDVDSKNFPNIPLMKLSAYHKEQGDSVEWYQPFGERYDNADPVKVSHLISGSARNLVVALAGFINENPVIFKPAIKLAEIIEAEEKKKKGS